MIFETITFLIIIALLGLVVYFSENSEADQSDKKSTYKIEHKYEITVNIKFEPTKTDTNK